jgi:hypothetical protein
MLRTIILSVLASALTSATVLLVGLALAAQPRAEAQTPIVAAHAFEVVDDAGRVVAYLGSANGEGSLVILDREGTARVRVYDSGVYLDDEHAVNRGTWALTTAGHPLDGASILALSDSEGNVVARLSERSDGQASLAFRNQAGELVTSDP